MIGRTGPAGRPDGAARVSHVTGTGIFRLHPIARRIRSISQAAGHEPAEETPEACSPEVLVQAVVRVR